MRRGLSTDWILYTESELEKSAIKADASPAMFTCDHRKRPPRCRTGARL